MYNLIYFLIIFVILAILFGKMINIDVPKVPRVLDRIDGHIERGNFTYFYLHYFGPVILNLTSLSGDADLYISETYMHPTYDPSIYDLHSATCGEDIIELPAYTSTPTAIGVYGHAESSDFLLEVYENLNTDYSYTQKALIDLNLNDFKNIEEIKSKQTTNDDKKSSDNNNQPPKKKKKTKTGSNIPGVFSVLEILQLIFL